MSLKKQALSGVFWTAAQQFGTQGIRFFVSIVLARILLPEEFGLIAMLGVFMGLGSALINGGLTSSLIRSPELDEEDFSTVFFFNLIGSIFIYLVVFFSAPLIASFFDQDLLIDIVRVYSVTFIIDAFSTVQSTRLTKLMDFKTQMKVSIPSLIMGSLVGIIMAYQGYGVWSLVWSSIVQSIAGSAQLWYWSKWMPLWIFNVKKFKYHFNFGVKLMFSNVLNTIFVNANTLLIGKFFAPAQVGFYNRANNLQKLPVEVVISVITKVSYPLFSAIQNDNIRLKGIYKKIMQMVIYLVAPTLILMAVLAEPLFRFLITEKWLPAVPYFQILCFNGILYPLHAYNLQILNVKGRSDLFLKLSLFKRSLSLIVMLVSVQFGIFALLYAQAALSFVGFFINAHYTKKFLAYSALEQLKDIFPIIILSLSCATLVFILDFYLKTADQMDIVRLLIGSFVGWGSYAVLSYMTKLEPFTEFRNLLNKNVFK